MEISLPNKMKKLESLIGKKIENEHYYLQALTCPSYAKEYNDVHDQKIIHHQSLAIVGDAVIKTYFAVKLFLENEEITKNELTVQKSKVENNQALNEVGKELNLEELLLTRNNDLDEGNQKSYATAIEAIVGAVYLEAGVTFSDTFIHNYIDH